MRKGIFITFEGNDGSGKTTVSKQVYEALAKQGYDLLYTREPGGIEIAEQIRKVILNPENTAMDARTEALLYAASRRQHLVERILPALAEGRIVLCDRFVDSSLAYQGVGRGLGIDAVQRINDFAIEGCMPDATIFLSVPLAVGLARVTQRGNLDRLDQENYAFHERVASGYEQVTQRFAQRIHGIDASRSPKEVIQDALETCQRIITSIWK